MTTTAHRLLRWTFRRDLQALTCEIGLNSDDSAYELRLNPWDPDASAIETFDDALQAFQRHAAIERVLIDEGWMLDGFESVIGATVANVSVGG